MSKHFNQRFKINVQIKELNVNSGRLHPCDQFTIVSIRPKDKSQKF